MTEKDNLLRKISTYDFAIVELNLYLDTHPKDKEAARKLDEYERESKQLRKVYEENYGPIIFRNSPDNRMKWIKNPWPWDTCEGD